MGIIAKAWSKLVMDARRTWRLGGLFDGEIEILYLSNALAGEVGELANIVKKWVRDIRSKRRWEVEELDVEREVGDILYYLVMFTDVLDLDIEAIWNRLRKSNEERYRENVGGGVRK